jgi:DNA-binding transcriptional ArsR family regulator
MDSTAAQVLAALKLEPNEAGQYRINSPFRTGSDSNAFSLHITDGEHGTWHDHVTQESGSLYDLLKRCPEWGIEPVRATIDSSKRVYTDHIDYALQKGVIWAVFSDAGFKPVRHMRRPAMAISTNNGVRYRYLDYQGGETYTNEKGFSACWYKLQEAVKMARATKQPLVYCNGEASTVVAQHFGIPAITLAGGGERAPTASHLAELSRIWSGSIIIALDCDKAGRAATAKATKALQDARISCYAVDMQLGNGGDLADWAKLYEAESMQRLASLEPQSFSATNELSFEFISADALDKKRFEALTWIVEELTPEGCFILAGKPKARKSWVGTHIARAVARGDLVFGKYKSTQGRVLYLDLESNERRMQSRLRQMEGTDSEGNPEGQPASLIITTAWSRGTDAVDDLEAFLLKYPDTVLVVIDILENFRGPRDKHANPYSEDYDAVKPLTMLAEKYHCAIICIHHTRKSKSDDAFDEISGTTGLAGGVSGMYILSRLPADETQSELLIRGRDIEADDKRLMTWNTNKSHHEVIGDPESFLLTKERAEVLAFLEDTGMHWRIQDIADHIGKSRQSTYNLVSRLRATGHVKQDQQGKYFIIKSVAPYVPVGYEVRAEKTKHVETVETVKAAEPMPRVTATAMIPDQRVPQLKAALQAGNVAEFERLAGIFLPTRAMIETLRQELSA